MRKAIPYLVLITINTLTVITILILVSLKGNNSVVFSTHGIVNATCANMVTEYLEMINLKDYVKSRKLLTKNNIHNKLSESAPDIFANAFCSELFNFSSPITLYSSKKNEYSIVMTKVTCQTESTYYYFNAVLENNTYKIVSWRIFSYNLYQCLLNENFSRAYIELGGDSYFGNIVDFYDLLSVENNLLAIYLELGGDPKFGTIKEFKSRIGLS